MKKITKDYLTLIRASAWYDLVVTAPFAFPLLSVHALALLRQVHVALGLHGSIPQFEAAHLLFMNLMGSLVVVWSVLRLRRTRVEYGAYDACARFLFAFCEGYYLFNSGLSALLAPFFVMECLFGVLQLYGFYLMIKVMHHRGSQCALVKRYLATAD